MGQLGGGLSEDSGIEISYSSATISVNSEKQYCTLCVVATVRLDLRVPKFNKSSLRCHLLSYHDAYKFPMFCGFPSVTVGAVLLTEYFWFVFILLENSTSYGEET